MLNPNIKAFVYMKIFSNFLILNSNFLILNYIIFLSFYVPDLHRFVLIPQQSYQLQAEHV